jgi:WD40 repeat protein/DNA-binding SARP family transcriptional activator
MDIRYLGPLEVLDAGRPLPLGGPKQRLVLAHLLIDADRTVPTDRLIDRVWAEGPPSAARTSLHSYVSNLRRVVGADRIVNRGQGYAFAVDGVRIDRLEFDDLVARGRRLLPTDPTEASRLLHAALDMWRGPAFADLAQEESLAGETASLADVRLAVVDDRVVADLACGRARELVSELRALAHDHPLYERFWAHLMVALYRSGRQGEALAAFTEARTVLAEELGVDPSPELARLHEQILRHDDVLDAAAPALHGYRLLEQIGADPSAVVWKATQPGVARVVALKALRPRFANDPGVIRRFDSDAQAVARVEHPHVVPLYDFWREADGAFLAMRYLPGGDLAAALEDGDGFAATTALRVIQQVAAAAGAAHRQGVVHGRITPSSVLFDDDGVAYLSGFSIATGGVPPVDDDHVAPEVRDGAPPDVPADVFALGVLLRQLVPETDGALAAVIARATNTDAADRYPDADAFLAAITAAAPVVPDAGRDEIGTAGTAVAVAARNPYKGLRAFVEGDAADFFGRDAFVDRLVARLADRDAGRCIVVVGPSGSGKSSVVRAGLVPALRRGVIDGSADWYVAQMLPDGDPFTELARALGPLAVDPPSDLVARLAGDGLAATLDRVLPDDQPLVLVIDQFEELFTQVTDADRRASFLRLIADAADAPDGRVWIVATLRADYYDRPLRAPAIAELVRAGTEAVVPMTAAELERAVTGPAERVGVAVERDLVAQIVADVATEPAALPLLQYALTEVFELRDDRRLTLDAYRRAGGITGALTRRADGELDRLAPRAREAAQQLFLRLVTPGDGPEGDTRRRVPVTQVEALAPETMPAVVAAFGSARLLTFDHDPQSREPTVEVAHEALLREWRQLTSWIDAARDDLRVRQRLTVAAADWVAADHDPSYLARGARLDRYEQWQRDARLTPTARERAFLDASFAARDADRRREVERAEREHSLERRSVRRLRALAAVLGIAALIAGALTIFAVTQARRAGDQAQVATARELAAGAAASLETDPERSILLAREAVRRTRAPDGSVQPEVASVLHHAVGASRLQLAVSGIGGYVDWSPDGDLFVTEGPEEEGVIDLRDAETGASVRRWVGHDVDINSTDFGPNGDLLVSTDDASTLKVWDVATGAEVLSYTSPDGGQLRRAAITPDGALVAGAWKNKDGRVRLIDIASGRVVREIPVEWAGTVAFDPRGQRVAIKEGPETEGPGSVIVADVATGATVTELTDVAVGLQDVAWSPDGRWLAVSSFAPEFGVYDATSGELAFTVTGHTAPVMDLAWHPDATAMVSGSFDGTAKVWELMPGGAREVATLSTLDMAYGVYSATFSPDGTRVLAADPVATGAAIWDLGDTTTAEGPVLRTYASNPQESDAERIAHLPDGTLATIDPDGGINVWDTERGERVRTVGEAQGRLDLLHVGDGGRWMSGATRDRLWIWDAATGDSVAAIAPTTDIEAAAWSADSPLLAVTDGDGDGSGGTIRLYGPDGTERGLLRAPGRHVVRLALAPDGRRLAATTTDVDRLAPTRVEIYDVASGGVEQRLIDADVAGLAWDDDGDRLVTSGSEGGAIVWDLATGEPIHTLVGEAGAVTAVAFDADATRIATAGFDGSVRVWDAERGIELVAPRIEGPVALNVAFSRDGSRLITADEDGAVRQWLLEIDDLLAIADERVTRDLTDDECRQYLHVDGCDDGS